MTNCHNAVIHPRPYVVSILKANVSVLTYIREPKLVMATYNNLPLHISCYLPAIENSRFQPISCMKILLTTPSYFSPVWLARSRSTEVWKHCPSTLIFKFLSCFFSSSLGETTLVASWSHFCQKFWPPSIFRPGHFSKHTSQPYVSC